MSETLILFAAMLCGVAIGCAFIVSPWFEPVMRWIDRRTGNE